MLLNALRKIYQVPNVKLVPAISTVFSHPAPRQVDVKSYAKNCIVWLKQNNLIVNSIFKIY